MPAPEPMFVEFVRQNYLLLAVALVSGTLLVWPYLRRFTGGPWVTPAQATLLINREDGAIIDVREPAEYAAGHALGAKNVPMPRIASAGADLAKRKDKPVIVYCETGERASKAAAALKQQGYTRVASLSGGMKAWREAGLPVEK